jgi:hypothetical protein
VTLADSTLKRELQRVVKAKNLAHFIGNSEAEDWLYGAEVALSWALCQDTMAPHKAFSEEIQ